MFVQPLDETDPVQRRGAQEILTAEGCVDLSGAAGRHSALCTEGRDDVMMMS